MRALRVCVQSRLGAKIVFDLPPFPGQIRERWIIREFAIRTVEKRHAFKIGKRLPEAMEVVRDGRWLIPAVIDEGLFQSQGGVLAKSFGKGLQYRQVCRALEIEHPSGLLGLAVLIEADLRERLAHLAPPTADAVRFADECDNQISLGGFVQKHLGVAGRNIWLPLSEATSVIKPYIWRWRRTSRWASGSSRRMTARGLACM